MNDSTSSSHNPERKGPATRVTKMLASRALLRDVRGTTEQAEVEAFYEAVFAPGSDHPHAARDLRWSVRQNAFLATGTRFSGPLSLGPTTDVCRIDARTGMIEIVRREARLARPSPHGDVIALVGDDGLVLLDGGNRETIHPIAGRIEQMEWSRDGSLLAILVAGEDADLSGTEGGFTLSTMKSPAEAWLPAVDAGDSEQLWRTIWVLRPGYGAPRQITTRPLNVWEFSWHSDDSLVAVTSDSHSEGSWYGAALCQIDLKNGIAVPLYKPHDQIALPRVSPDGEAIAFIEAVCSDRGIVCGALRLWRNGTALTLNTLDVDVSDHHWSTRGQLLFAGLRGLSTVIGASDPETGNANDLWAAEDLTCGDWHPSIAIDADDTPFGVFEAYARAPFVGAVHPSGITVIADLKQDNAADAIPGSIEALRWHAPDGLEIQGWLIRDAKRPAPAPLLIDIHGGPIWAHRNRWAARLRATGPLVACGWCVLLPNPRGAAGRGRAFASQVIGDMGGADAQDIISGVDHLVGAGMADPARVAVTGTSYGGFMSAMLVTLTNRLAAAVPISPVSNWYSQHFTSQIPSFDEACLEGTLHAAGGQYFDRSPAFHAAGATTPTLTMAGALDRNTPPGQALEFHRALLEAGCPSALCTYPQDGHSLRGYPAYLDSAVRTIIWLSEQCREKGRGVGASGTAVPASS